MDIIRKKVRALRHLFQSESDNTKRLDLKIRLKKERASYKRLVLSTKTNAFKDYLNSITKSNTYGSAFKIIKDKYKENSLSHQIIKMDGSCTDNYNESRKITFIVIW